MALVDQQIGRCARPLLLLALLAAASPCDEALEKAVTSQAANPEPADTSRAPEFELQDQFGTTHQYAYPREKVAVLLIADKEGSKQVSTWVVPLHERFQDRIDIDGVADLSAVPAFLRGTVRFFIKRSAEHPIMLDWDGAVCGDFVCAPGKVNVFVVNKDGGICLTLQGAANDSLLKQLYAEIDRLHRPKTDT
ncbi:MAG: hypothetical protein IT365_14975 [Candidatus Hydrogenedentes bacterium]|nr:hypothetical protein [Candidatus Hydrogenedentota bacterium]